MAPNDIVENLVAGCVEHGWRRVPQFADRVMEIVHTDPHGIATLCCELVRRVDNAGNISRVAYQYLPYDAWPEVVAAALDVRRTRGSAFEAANALAHAACQTPRRLHPYLHELFDIGGDVVGSRPWRESDDLGFLTRVLDDPTQLLARHRRAWRACLEMRTEQSVRAALERQDRGGDDADSTQELRAMLWSVGYALEASGDLRVLESQDPYHTIFPADYIHRMGLPAWQTSSSSWRSLQQGTPARFGGTYEGTCATCGDQLDHLITLDPPPDRGLVSMPRLTLATCVSCIGCVYGEPFRYYQHDASGQPREMRTPETRPQEEWGSPAEQGPLLACEVTLANLGPRWRWQEAGTLAGNLNRVGGPAAWWGEPEFPNCPTCGRNMRLLLQLDSGLPCSDGGHCAWGDAGLFYVCWCDRCRVSAAFWRST